MKNLALFALFVAFILQGSAIAQTASDHFARGDAFSTAQNWIAAIDEYTKAIRLDPNHEPSLHKRGEAYWRSKKYDLALADLNKAAQLAPNEAQLFCDRGRMLLESVGWNIYRGEFDKGYADLKKALQLDPNEAHAKENILSADTARLNIKADTELNKGNVAEATKLYSEALVLRPNNLYSLFNRGRAYLRNSQNELAIADFDAYIAQETTEPAAFHNRGIAKYNLGKYDDCISDQTKAISLKPSWIADAYVRRGRAIWAKKDLINASVDFDNALRHDPNSVFALINKAVIYSERKIFDVAILNATKAIALQPETADLYLERGDIYKASGDVAKALADYEQMTKLAATSKIGYLRRVAIFKETKSIAELEAEYERFIKALPNEGLNARGHYYYSLKNYPKALADFLEWHRSDASSIAALQMLVYTYEEMGNYSEALRYSDLVVKTNPMAYDFAKRGAILFKLKKIYDAAAQIDRALSLEPANGYALRWRGRIRTELGDLTGALEDYGRSLEQVDKSSETYHFRGLLYAKLGKKPEAIADLKRAIELDPNNSEAKSALANLNKTTPLRKSKK